MSDCANCRALSHRPLPFRDALLSPGPDFAPTMAA